MVSQVGVDLVGEVHGSRTGGQLNDTAFGCIDEYLVVEDVLFDRLDEFSGPGDFPLPFKQLAQPGHLFLEPLVAGVPLFISPMGRHAVFGNPV